MAKLVRRAIKIFFFIVLSMLIGHSFDIYSLVSTDIAIGLAYKLFGDGGLENVEAAYALIDAGAIIVLTTAVYLLVIALIRHFKKS
ncbi:MAG: hypothetical protein ABN478_09520 [Mixta sp.]